MSTTVSNRLVATSLLLAIALAALLASASSAASTDAGRRCRTSDLRLRAGAYGEAASQFVQTLTFTDESSASCTLGGWPSVRV